MDAVARPAGRADRELHRAAARRRVDPAALDRPRAHQHAAVGRGVVRRDRPGRDLASPRRDHRSGPAGAARPAGRRTRTAPRSAARSAPSGRSAWSRSRCGRSCRAGSRSCRGRCAGLVVAARDAPGGARRAPHLRRLRALAGAAPHHRALRRGGLRPRRARRDAVRRRAAPALELRRGRRHRPRLLRLPRAARALLPVAARLPGATPCARSTRAWSRSRCAPIGRPIDFVPGQFAMVYLEAKDGWHRHPFTISSAPHEDVVRVTVKALGDYTSRLQELVEPGMPAVIGGPHGRFSHRKGTDRQVWIAGGVGVAPFLSWLRALDGHAARIASTSSTRADGEAPFADEIRAIADRHESLHAHLIDTSVDGRLTPERVLAAADGDRASCRSSCAVRSADAAHLPDRAALGGRPGPADPPRALRLALTIGGPRVRCPHVRRDAAPSGPPLGRTAPGGARPDAPARAPRSGWRSTGARRHGRRRSGAWPCAARR